MAPEHDSTDSETRPTMKDGYIRDRTGRIIGRMDGNWLRDGTGKLVARYDAWDNRTRTRKGKIVGDGDQRLRALGEKQGPD
jgi:hypothetical protein